MSSYKKISRADITLELFEDLDNYSASIFSTNGVILQPYDLSTTLIGSLYKNNIDITSDKTIKYRWTKWTPSNDNMSTDNEWNNKHTGFSKIEITKDDVQDKAIFTFEAYRIIPGFVDEEILLASSNISIIDINDLLISTEKPKDPYTGQIWIDDKTEPATIYMWNGYKWIIAGSVDAMVKNLLRDTAFYGTSNYWKVVGDTKNLYTPTTISYLGKRYIRLCSEVLISEERGIEQITTDKVVSNSGYSFQMLYYSKIDTETFSNNINISIYSLDANDKETLIFSKQIKAISNIQQFFYNFDTLSDTTKLKVKITGEDNKRFNFYIGEMALYNCITLYPWTMHPLDMFTVFDRETLFNVLTDNGAIEGIYSEINPDTGQIQYYINASYIGAGKLSAQYLDAYNLRVKRKNNPEIITFEITENGDVNLRVNNLTLQATGQTIEEYVTSQIPDFNGSGDALDTLLKQIKRDEAIINFTYNEIYNNENFKNLDFIGNVDDWLLLEDKPSYTITKMHELLYNVNVAYLKSNTELKACIAEAKNDYELNKPTLDRLYDTYVNKLGIENKLFITCQEYIGDAKLEFANKEWTNIKTEVGNITISVGKINETIISQGKEITSITQEVSNIKQEITPESITTKVQYIVSTDSVVNAHIETVAKQSAEGFNQEVVDKLNGNFSRLEQTVNGFNERIELIEKKPNYKLVMETPEGTVIRSVSSTTTVYAKVYNWDDDITSTLTDDKFNWYRKSKDMIADDEWHKTNGVAKKTITINANDINKNAVFYFTVDI